MHEHLWFSLGPYANYTTVHTCNSLIQLVSAQDASGRSEFDARRFFRTSVSPDRESYVPRSLFFDLKSNYGSLGRNGWVDSRALDAEQAELQALAASSSSFSNVEVIREVPPSKTRYALQLGHALQKDETLETVRAVGDVVERVDFGLDEDVRTWSDFMSFDPDSLNLLQANTYASSFDVFSQGRLLMRGSEPSSFLLSSMHWEDQVHRMLEECDFVDGIVITVDVNSAFSGSAGALLEYLKQNSKAFRLVVPVSDDDGLDVPKLSELADPSAFPSSFFNRCLAHHGVFESASLILPLSASRVAEFANFAFKNPPTFYQSSSVLSLAMETLLCETFSTGMSSQRSAYGSVFGHLPATSAMKFCALGASLPFPVRSQQSLCDSLFESPDFYLRPDFVNLTSECFSPDEVRQEEVRLKAVTSWKRMYDEDDDEGAEDPYGDSLHSDDAQSRHLAEIRFRAPFSYYSVARGLGSIPGSRISHSPAYKFSRESEGLFSMEWARAEDAGTLWSLYHSTIPTRLGRCFHANQPIVLPVTFPSVTRSSLSSYGEVVATDSALAPARHVLSLPTASMCHTSRGIGHGFRRLHQGLVSQKSYWTTLSRFYSDTERDDWENVSEFMARMSDQYTDAMH